MQTTIRTLLPKFRMYLNLQRPPYSASACSVSPHRAARRRRSKLPYVKYSPPRAGFLIPFTQAAAASDLDRPTSPDL
jgi:hypothetical protein